MNAYAPVTESAMMQRESAAIKQASINALAQRRASGEILLYELDGWVVNEYPGGRIERLAPVGKFRAADFPYPGSTPLSR